MNIIRKFKARGALATLQKLTIEFEGSSTTNPLKPSPVTALFNPNEVIFSNQVSWRTDQTAMSSRTVANQQTNLQSIQPATLTVNLLFDTYEGDPRAEYAEKLQANLLPRLSPLYYLGWEPLASPNSVSVIPFTDSLARLTYYDEDLHRPPICTLTWGSWRLFVGVLSSLSRTFKLFLKDGTPVRATCQCTFTEYLRSDVARELFSPDVYKTYTVRPGDTLINIAVALYADASRWRIIAEANRIDDPRQITPGQVLRIPPLPAGDQR
jgi:nucleoid-associated protein YgaU